MVEQLAFAHPAHAGQGEGAQELCFVQQGEQLCAAQQGCGVEPAERGQRIGCGVWAADLGVVELAGAEQLALAHDHSHQQGT